MRDHLGCLSGVDCGSCCRFEILLSRFENSRRYEVFTSDMHRDTLEQNSRLVDENEKLQRELSALKDDLLIFRQNATAPRPRQLDAFDSSVSPGSVGGTCIKISSAYIGSDGKVPSACPVGGCSHYDSVLKGSDPMKNFQNHMNNTHRVIVSSF